MARRLTLLAVLILALAGASRLTAHGGFDFLHAWRMIGNDPANSRNQRFEHRIGPWDARRLAVKWVATTTGDVSATPAVANGAVYFGDFGGTL